MTRAQKAPLNLRKSLFRALTSIELLGGALIVKTRRASCECQFGKTPIPVINL